MAIDPDILAFVEDSERFTPPDEAARSLPEQRRQYEAYASAFAPARAVEVRGQDASLVVEGRAIPLRRYTPAARRQNGIIVYAHGGGFILGSLESHDAVVARLALLAGSEVVAVDYRLAPEHPAPAPLDDVVAVTEAAARGALPWPDLAGGPLLLAGDSAGGTLAAAAALRLAGPVPIAGVALIYPALGYEPAEPARSTETEAPMLTLADVRAYRDQLLGGRAPEAGLFPLDAPVLNGFPPCFILAAEHDPLRDDGMVFARRLAEVGVQARCEVGTGLVHGFLRAIDRSAAARGAFEQVAAFLADCMARAGGAT